MIRIIRENWDIIVGGGIGVVLTVLSDFKLQKIQLCYSVIILILASIGIVRVFKQALDKRYKRKEHSIIDAVLDSNKTIKVIGNAEAFEEEGERVGRTIINIMGVTKMGKFKEFFSKFKGYMLTIVLTLLTILEMCSGYINELCGGTLTVKGVEVLPIATLVLAIIVGMLSNGFSSEQIKTLKSLAGNKVTNGLVVAEMKKNIKANEEKLSQLNKEYKLKIKELKELEVDIVDAKNTYEALTQMEKMIPQLATAEEVKLASNEIVNVQTEINAKKKEINEVGENIKILETTINAIKAQL